MKKKILSIAFVVAIAVTAGINMNQNNNEVSLTDLALSNVEALAQSENSGGGGPDWNHSKLVFKGGRQCCESGWANYKCSGTYQGC